MSRKKDIFKILGATADYSITAISGVFKMYDTLGMPLSILLEMLRERDLMPCWPTFFEDADKAGWKLSTAESRVFEAIVDSYGNEYFKEWKSRYDEWRMPSEESPPSI